MLLRIKYFSEYVILQMFSVIINTLPYRVALMFAWCLAAFTFHILRFRRAETIRRIRQVFGATLTARQVEKIAWQSMRNMAFNVVEMMRAHKIDLAWMERYMPESKAQILAVKTLIEKHGGAVITVPHMGNWDLAGWACHRYGIKMFSVAAKQKNPLVNSWINRQRESGMTILERGGGTMKQIIRLLRSGNALAILPDVRVYTSDLRIPFLGGIANFGRGMAQFAITANVPVIPAILRREGWSQHRFEILSTIFPDATLSKDESIRNITETVMACVDTAIRATPEQWFWYNKRWVLTPVAPLAPLQAVDK